MVGSGSMGRREEAEEKRKIKEEDDDCGLKTKVNVENNNK